jgi:Zn-dependent peptidase ImmA (M78 family)
MRAKHFDRSSIVTDFVNYCAKQLNLLEIPKLSLISDPMFSHTNKTFGQYEPDTDHTTVNINNRNLVDVLRTIAHELVHAAQDQGTIDAAHNTGLPGKDIENVANAVGGKLVRDYTQSNGKYFRMTAE